MKKSLLFACCLFMLPAPFALACEYPGQAPAVPNGSTASKEEMLAGKKEVEEHIKQLEQYQQCLIQAEQAARAEAEYSEEELKRRDDVLTKKHDAAYEEIVKLAAAFNEELNEFQSRNNQ
ncbi:MAG TPA: hypothetical protein VKZ85_10390 [Woeseiaceae bacterium]|nr:hypothetical protein [Woeseiaceae bacterium]